MARAIHDMDLSSANVEISAIKKTQAGDMKVCVIGGREKAHTLHEAIKDQLPNARVAASRQKRKVLHIRDLEACCTKEDIVSGISQALGRTDTDMVISSLRDGYGNTTNATVIIAEEQANQLLLRKRVLIGIVSAPIRERVFQRSPPKCPKCWETKHAGKCEGPDRSNECFRCHETGHQRRDCTSKRDTRKDSEPTNSRPSSTATQH